MPKNMPILEAHWPDFLFDCSVCPNADECMEQGICRHEIPSDDDYEFDDIAKDDVKDFFENEVYASLDRNFNYND